MLVTALASGSSGNAYLVQAGETRLLLDAGLPPPLLERFLRQQGVAPARLTAICLSHEHSDHVRGVGALARRYRLPVIANEGTFMAASEALGPLPERAVLPTGGERRSGAITLRTFPVSHDARDPVGFWVSADDADACVCTDLGTPTAALEAPLAAADLIILEANHDPERLQRGPYPPALKRRVAGPQGHLANGVTAQLALAVARDNRARALWLAHLSATNNTPLLAFNTVTRALAQEDCWQYNVNVAMRNRPSLTWDSTTAERGLRQLRLPF